MKETAKEKRLKRIFNISLNEHSRILEYQNYKCAICSRPLKKPNLDHCHKSGLVRGFLCFRCNKGIALFSDNFQWLLLAAGFLQSPPATRVLGKPRYGLPGGVNAKIKYKLKLKEKWEKLNSKK